MFEMVIIWSDGSIDVYEYGDRESAEKAQRGMHIALGNQIQWSGIRPKTSRKLNKEISID